MWLRRPNVLPIAMSEFGTQMLEADKIEHAYVPHAIEKVFHPTPFLQDADGDKLTGRELMKIDDEKFVVMMNSANKGKTPVRKCFGENLLAFAIFAQKHPDAVLYLHTEESDAATGVDLRRLIAACGIKQEQVQFVDQYQYRLNIPQSALAALYTAADVLLACSAGEGFGVPVIEAQACGTRVIVADATAQPELVGDGWKIPVQPTWDPFQHSWFFTPNVPSIVNALEEAYAKDREPSKQAMDYVAKYDADFVYAEYWRPVMQRIAEWSPSA